MNGKPESSTQTARSENKLLKARKEEAFFGDTISEKTDELDKDTRQQRDNMQESICFLLTYTLTLVAATMNFSHVLAAVSFSWGALKAQYGSDWTAE